MLTDNTSDNTIKAIRFDRPDYIPVFYWINPACRLHYHPDELAQLIDDHPILFPYTTARRFLTAELAPWERADTPFTDYWNCTWRTTDDGITGVVADSPLSDWSALDRFRPPDPASTDGMIPLDWPAIERRFAEVGSAGGCPVASLPHGHTFQRLTYLRGYENLLFDMADNSPQLQSLFDTVERFNLELVTRYLRCGARILCYPEDLGMQQGPMLSPDQFRSFIAPTYERLVAPARDAECIVHMHSDGDIRPIAADMVAAGLDAMNLQDLVNGIEWIAENLKGEICIDLDIDRQKLTPFASPGEIDAHIRRCVETLGDPAGGLMMIYGLYPGVPIQNARAVADAMQKYATYYR